MRRRKRPGVGFFLGCLFFHRGFQAVFSYRLGRALRGWPFLPRILRRLAAFWTHVSIHETAEIGPGLVLPHPFGVVIGRNVKIGKGAHIYQGVVLGTRGQDAGKATAPSIGDHVHLYPYSSVLGKVTVGDLTEIGANSVVLKSVPCRSVVMPPTSTVFKGMSFSKSDFETEKTPSSEVVT